MAPRDKLMEPVGGVPLLRDRALAALATGAAVVVTLPPDRPERETVIADLALRIVFVRQASEGMGRSIAAGVAATRGAAGAMLLPADMPDITTAALAAMMDAFDRDPGAIHRGASRGRPGHPVIFPADLMESLADLDGDEGARRIVEAHADRVRLHDLPGLAATCDLDTPAAWANWRARTGR